MDMGSPSKPLSERERRFVEAYMGKAAGNATKAAILAGYSAKSAARIGYRLTRKVQIANALQARVQSDPGVASREDRQAFWSRVMYGKGKFGKAALKDRLKASELLGKSQMDFTPRDEAGNPLPLEIRLTDDDAQTASHAE